MKEYNNLLVSVITVCYNSAETIEDTIKSVLSQTYKNWEHIIVDGGSKDNTISIIKSYEKIYDGRLRLYQGPDKGIYDAMNKGIGLAKGTIIGIINSDDWYAIDALENIVIRYQKEGIEEAVITGGLNRVRDGVIIYTQLHKRITLEDLKKGMPLQHPAVFVAKKVYDRVGTFNLNYPHIADYDFIWRCYADKNVTFEFVDSVVSYMREGGASDTLSWNHIKSRTVERYKLRKRYIPKMEAFLSSLSFLIKAVISLILKDILGAKRLKKMYDLKKRLNILKEDMVG